MPSKLTAAQRGGFLAPRKTLFSRRRVKASQKPRRAPAPKQRPDGKNFSSCVLPKAPFARLLKELTQKYNSSVKMAALGAELLQEAAEALLVQLFADAALLAEHGRRITIMDRDVALLLRLQRPHWWR